MRIRMVRRYILASLYRLKRVERGTSAGGSVNPSSTFIILAGRLLPLTLLTSGMLSGWIVVSLHRRKINGCGGEADVAAYMMGGMDLEQRWRSRHRWVGLMQIMGVYKDGGSQ